MSGYELIPAKDLPGTPDELKEAAHGVGSKALRMINAMAAHMDSDSVWCGVVGRGLLHGNLHTQEYMTELMMADGIDLGGIEWRVSLRAGRSGLLLANNVAQRYVITRDALDPPKDSSGAPLMGTDTLYRQLGHILDITASGAHVQIGIITKRSLGAMAEACVDHLYTSSDVGVPVTTMEGDTPTMLVGGESAAELLQQSSELAALPPDISRHIIENRWKALRP